MSDAVIIVCIIALSVVVIGIVVLIGILLYNQMLATNEVNKRLLLITKESIDKERSTQEELQEALLEIDRLSNDEKPNEPKSDNPLVTDEDEFNPHSFGEDNYKED